MTKNLSKYQLSIVEKMKEDDVYLWHNDGANFRAWLGNSKGKEIKSVRIDSAEALHNKGVIKITDGDYPSRLFRYKLTGKFEVNKDV